jgi:hypothetical protein
LIPYGLGIVLLLMIVFGVYVHSVPPKAVVVPPVPDQPTIVVDTEEEKRGPMVNEALAEAEAILKKMPPPAAEETVEL